jgi:co-chaperonin GroES (HSP10)
VNFDSVDLETFQPLGNRILVEREFGAGHFMLAIPDVSATYDRVARVLRVGPKVKEVKDGDLVLLPGMALNHPDFETQDYAVITEEDVAGVMEEENVSGR